MITLFDLAASLLDASDTMTTYLGQHQAELARGEQPHVFTATDAYTQLLEAAEELRHGLELAQALETHGAGSDITSPIEGLIEMHGVLLEHNPHAYFELAYTHTTGWMAWVCDKPATGTPGTEGYGSNRKVLASGQGSTPEEACDNAIDQLLYAPDKAAQILANEIPC